MRILCVQLLRLGDVLMTAPAMASLSEQFPNAEVDLLVNESSRQAANLIPNLSKIFEFPRNQIQKLTSDPDQSVLAPCFVVESLLNQLNARDYDLVVNFTQNKLSARICSHLNCDEILGVCFESDCRVSFGSPWYRYIDQHIAAGGQPHFNYSDVFRFSVGGNSDYNNIELKSLELKNTMIQKILSEDVETRVCLQMFSSDIKKNWPKQSVVDFVRWFSRSNPGVQFVFLSAPNESEQTSDVVAEIQSLGANAVAAVCSLSEALELIKASQLLITVDTAIKHLAQATETKVVELALGSSEPQLTGAVRSEQLIVQAQVTCSPCEHSSDCPFESFYCQGQMSGDVLFSLIQQWLKGTEAGILEVAKEFKDQIQVFQSERTQLGFWYLRRIGDVSAQTLFQDLLDRLSWKCYLNQVSQNPFLAYGSYSVALLDVVREWVEPDRMHRMSALLPAMERTLYRQTQELERLIQCVRLPKRDSELMQGLKNLGISAKGEVALFELVAGLPEKNSSLNFNQRRRLQEALESCYQRSQIKSKIVRTMTQRTELEYTL